MTVRVIVCLVERARIVRVIILLVIIHSAVILRVIIQRAIISCVWGVGARRIAHV